MKKLILAKETLRTLDDQELSLVAGGNNSGSNVPPVANGCPSSKGPGNSCHWPKGDFMKKLILAKETLRTLDDQELSLVAGGSQSGSNVPPNGGPNTCPNTKGPGNSCT
jgi:hypothetical protein